MPEERKVSSKGRIVLGITSSAAAYKGVALASLIRKAGYDVDGVLTPGACRLVTPLQLACVTGRPVRTLQFEEQPGDPIPHITLSEGAAALVVAPATANFLGKLAAGIADDLLSTTALACECRVLVAPSMNTRMWEHPAVRENVSRLCERGVVFAGPVHGLLACGSSGAGRMMEPADILDILLAMLGGETVR